MTLFREPELRDIQLQITKMRAALRVLEHTIAAHAALIANVQHELDALNGIRITTEH